MDIDKQARILENLGLKTGDRIAVCLPTNQQLIELLLASHRIGAIFCPLNPKLPQEALQEQLLRLAPKLICSSSGFETRTSYPSPLLPSSLLLFTSGSTGLSKIVSLSIQSFWNSAKSANLRCDLRPNDSWLLSLPMHHVSGLSVVYRCLLAKAHIILDEKDPSITHLSTVAAKLYTAWPIYRNLRCLLLGGGPIHNVPNELPCLVSYGMTETASLFLAGPSPHSLQPLTGKEIKLGIDGEILVRGDSLFEGYWDGEHLHTPFDPEGWFATKDLAHFDPASGFTIVGRKDNQFISGGENIQPEEIERELLQLPGILEAIVGPRKHDRFGMRPIAFIKTNGSLNEASIRRSLAKRLPSYKIPDAFFLLDSTQSPHFKLNRKQMFQYSLH